jgi:hypothetical protein
MSGENPNAAKLRENDAANEKGDPRPGFTSICKDPKAKGNVGVSKLHHKGKRKK